MKIIHESTLANSKAFTFVMEKHLDLLLAGHADTDLNFNNSMRVSYAVSEDTQIMGAIVWFYDLNKRACSELLSVVDPGFRRQGVYTKLLAEVEAAAKRLGAVAIYAGIHVSNEAMIAAQAKVGKQLSWYRAKKAL